jgi:hypothetical protein
LFEKKILEKKNLGIKLKMEFFVGSALVITGYRVGYDVEEIITELGYLLNFLQCHAIRDLTTVHECHIIFIGIID